MYGTIGSECSNEYWRRRRRRRTVVVMVVRTVRLLVFPREQPGEEGRFVATVFVVLNLTRGLLTLVVLSSLLALLVRTVRRVLVWWS